jgi:hypothetical protein
MKFQSTTEIFDTSRRDEWDAYLDKNNLAIAWQRWEWHDILNKHYPHDFYPLAAVQNNTICGVFPLYKLHDAASARSFISIPFAVAGGIVSDAPEIEKLLLDEAVRLAKQEHVDSIIVKQYKHKVDGDLRTDATFFNCELSLLSGLDNVWKNLARENQDMISGAKKDGLTLEYPSNSIDQFYSILFAHHHRQGVPCVSRKWIEDLITSSMYSLALVYCNGQVIAGTMVKTFKKTVSFPFTALKKNNGNSQRAVYWLYWELISLFSQKGYEIIHSGRIPADESVPRFRLGWGGDKNDYYYQYYPNVSRATESSIKRGLKRRIAGGVWRLSPKIIAAALGPKIVRKFP